MTSMNVSLPGSMKAFVDGQVNRAGYSTASEYIRALIREDQKRQAKTDLEAKLLEGLHSGPGVEMTDEFWDDFRARLQQRARKARKS